MHLNYGQVLYEEALKKFCEVSLLKGNLYLAPFNLGCAFVIFGRYNKAREEFERAIQLGDLYGEAHFNFGHDLLDVG